MYAMFFKKKVIKKKVKVKGNLYIHEPAYVRR